MIIYYYIKFHINIMDSNVEDYLLVAKVGLTNLKIIIQLLKAINFKEVFQIHLYLYLFFYRDTKYSYSIIIQTTAVCLGSENGLKITVEDAKCMQATVYIPSAVFDEFELKEDVIFSISVNILIECLCMFWPASQDNSVAVQIFYKVN